MTAAGKDWLRYGWPRWYLLRLHGRLPTEAMNERLLDFLYPDDAMVSFLSEER